MQTVAISWLMATISASDLMVALVQAASTLPVFFLSILAGAIADNFSRRWVMFAGALPVGAGVNDAGDFCGTGIYQPLAHPRTGFPRRLRLRLE